MTVWPAADRAAAADEGGGAAAHIDRGGVVRACEELHAAVDPVRPRQLTLAHHAP